MSDELRIAARELARAIKFFDEVRASSEDERIAVGSDHWDWLISAARKVARSADNLKEEYLE